MMWASIRATTDERARGLPGDERIPQAIDTLTHGVTIRRAPRDVWPCPGYRFCGFPLPLTRLVIRVVHVIMQRKQLLGIMHRAESMPGGALAPERRITRQ